MKEPSILDYLKSRLNPWQKEKIQIPWNASATVEEPFPPNQPQQIQDSPGEPDLLDISPSSNAAEDAIPVTRTIPATAAQFPWKVFLALGLALLAQRTLEPPADSFVLAFSLYFFALVLLVWAYMLNEFSLPDLHYPHDSARSSRADIVQKPQLADEDAPIQKDPLTYRRKTLIYAMLLALSAFILLNNNLFTSINVTIWLAAMGLFVRGLWLSDPGKPAFFTKVVDFFKRDKWQLSITRWGVLLFAVAALVIFFRFYRLDGVPGEPFSDHAEKLLDVFDVTQGQTHIFFPRNTGREFIQFYWTALVSILFNTGLTFFSLKLGTALIGLFTMPYIYLLGKEIGGKRVAMFALILAGTSYWLNTISRIGLRFPLYPAFAAPTLYYLIRGLRRQNRNDFILSGLFLGLGLNGYSPFRFVPFVALLGLALYLLHKQSVGNRKQTMMLFSILVLASFMVFIPLMRYIIQNQESFSYRTMTRLTGIEQPLKDPAWQIFISNTFNAMTMFYYDNGETWVHSIPHRPALDVVSAVLFLIGYLFLLARYLRNRHWLDLFLILSVPTLLMPSILSLAFPSENPSLNRTGAAAVIVFIIAAMALDGIYTGLQSIQGAARKRGFAAGVVILLLLVSSLQNYNLVFNTFASQFLDKAWNTSDIGKVIRSFVDAGNSPDNAFVVPYPYWVDTRLVGIQAGYPSKDYAVSRDDLPKTLATPGNKLFIVKEEDVDTLAALRKLYPFVQVGHFTSPLEGKNFWIYSIPDNAQR